MTPDRPPFVLSAHTNHYWDGTQLRPSTPRVLACLEGVTVAPFDPRIRARPHQYKEGCVCAKCADHLAHLVRQSVLSRPDPVDPRVKARGRLMDRVERVDLGLSNPAYLHAAPVAPVRDVLYASSGSHWDAVPRPSDLAARQRGALGVRAGVVAAPEPLPTWNPVAGALDTSHQLVREHAPAQVRLTLKPSRLVVSFSDAISDHLSPAAGSKGGRRGVITELSEAARNRLADMAVELTESGKLPTDIVTLTSPANWQDVYLTQKTEVKLDKRTGQRVVVPCATGGRLFKDHLRAFRERLTRYFKKHDVHAFSALWFLEFQARGAPHVHFILFDVDMTPELRKKLRGWLGRAWSSIVGNPSKHEQDKHRRAGTQIARMKKSHFGYAAKYASKAEQKEVPEEFNDVGRFWGVWNYKKVVGDVLTFDYSHLNKQDTDLISRVLVAALATIHDKSPSFMMSRLEKVQRALNHGLRCAFGFSVYGGAASRRVLELLT